MKGRQSIDYKGVCSDHVSFGLWDTKDVMDHVGWFSEKSFDRYSRMGKMAKLSVFGIMMRHISTYPDKETNISKCFGGRKSLLNAF